MKRTIGQAPDIKAQISITKFIKSKVIDTTNIKLLSTFLYELCKSSNRFLNGGMILSIKTPTIGTSYHGYIY